MLMAMNRRKVYGRDRGLICGGDSGIRRFLGGFWSISIRIFEGCGGFEDMDIGHNQPFRAFTGNIVSTSLYMEMKVVYWEQTCIESIRKIYAQGSRMK